MTVAVKRIKVASYDELSVRSGRSLTLGDKQIALFRLTNGKVYAIEDKSPHPKGGVLSEGLVSGNYVFCPVYDIKISLLDGRVQKPDKGEVQTYKTEVEGGEVFLLLA